MSDAVPPAVPHPETPSAQTSPAPSEPSARIAPILVGFAYLAFWQIAPRLRTDSLPAILLSTIISLALIIWFTAQFARTLRTPRALALNALLAAAVIVPLRVMLGFGRVYAPWSSLLNLPGLPDLLFVWFAASLGALLAFLLRGANMIPPVAAVLALVDIWTVLLGGPVQQIMESKNPVAQAVTKAMTVQLPTPKPRGAAPFPPPTVVGFADFLFVAFFVAAICRFIDAPNTYRRMLIILIFVLCAYMLVLVFRDSLRLPENLNLPALVPIAVVMIALHWRHFHYDRSEAFALLYAALFIVVIALGFWYFGRHNKPPAEPPRASSPPVVGSLVR